MDTVTASLAVPGAELASNQLSQITNFARVTISGTHTGVQVRIDGSPDGTIYKAILAMREDTFSEVTWPLTLTSNETVFLLVAPHLLNKIKVVLAAISTGSISVRIDSGAIFPPPITFQMVGGS